MILQNIFFLDAEMVPECKTFQELSPAKQLLFLKRFDRQIFSAENPTTPEEFYIEKAAMYAEFGRIVCVTVGTLHGDTFYLKRIYGKDEKEILTKLSETLVKAKKVVGHNLKEFDGPYIFRRCIVHSTPTPAILNTIGLKPWETHQVDTMEIWGSTQWKYMVSLDGLCELLGVPSPKGEMTGADVAGVYWKAVDESATPEESEEQFLKIANYCSGDVIADARLYCRMMGLPGIDDDKIKIVS